MLTLTLALSLARSPPVLACRSSLLVHHGEHAKGAYILDVGAYPLAEMSQHAHAKYWNADGRGSIEAPAAVRVCGSGAATTPATMPQPPRRPPPHPAATPGRHTGRLPAHGLPPRQSLRGVPPGLTCPLGLTYPASPARAPHLPCRLTCPGASPAQVAPHLPGHKALSGLGVLKEALRLMERHYPETLHRVYFYRPGTVHACPRLESPPSPAASERPPPPRTPPPPLTLPQLHPPTSPPPLSSQAHACPPRPSFAQGFRLIFNIFRLWVPMTTRDRFVLVRPGQEAQHFFAPASAGGCDLDRATAPREFGGDGPSLDGDRFLMRACEKYDAEATLG